MRDADDKRWITVVGVAGNIIDDWFSRRNGPMLYVPMPQRPSYIVNLVVRAGGDPTALSGELRRLLKSIDPSQPPVHVMTMKGMLHERTVGLQMIGAMMGVLGALAVVLAAIGLYSLMAYHVSQRRHEIGVRMALGASQATVIRQTVRRGPGGSPASAWSSAWFRHGCSPACSAASSSTWSRSGRSCSAPSSLALVGIASSPVSCRRGRRREWIRPSR